MFMQCSYKQPFKFMFICMCAKKEFYGSSMEKNIQLVKKKLLFKMCAKSQVIFVVLLFCSFVFLSNLILYCSLHLVI